MTHSINKQSDGKWVATVDAIASRPLRTKKEAQAWIDAKQLDSVLGPVDTRLMSAAIIKGLIEKNDGTAYFGSTLIYKFHFSQAVEFGYVTENKKVTARGREWYDRCLKSLAPSRQVFWGDVGLANTNL